MVYLGTSVPSGKSRAIVTGTGMNTVSLAVAAIPEGFKGAPYESIEKDLTFAGLLAMIDPPREEVKEAVVTRKQVVIMASHGLFIAFYILLAFCFVLLVEHSFRRYSKQKCWDSSIGFSWLLFLHFPCGLWSWSRHGRERFIQALNA
jgi:hypothetical protein